MCPRRSARTTSGEPKSRRSPSSAPGASRARPTRAEPTQRRSAMGRRYWARDSRTSKPWRANACRTSAGLNDVNDRVFPSTRSLSAKKRSREGVEPAGVREVHDHRAAGDATELADEPVGRAQVAEDADADGDVEAGVVVGELLQITGLEAAAPVA